MSENDIGAGIDALEAINTELVQISEAILEPVKMINMIINHKKDEIWCGDAASEYWEIIKKYRDMMNTSRDKINTLAKDIAAYRTEIIENNIS